MSEINTTPFTSDESHVQPLRRQLTDEQISTLRAAQVNGPNKLKLAMALVDVRQHDLVIALGFDARRVSQIVTGRTPDISLTTAQAFATYFGCKVDDLFPRVAA